MARSGGNTVNEQKIGLKCVFVGFCIVCSIRLEIFVFQCKYLGVELLHVRRQSLER